MTISITELKEMVFYENGHLYWKTKPCRNIKVGAIIGNNRKRKYQSIQINKKQYLVHRVVFLYHHGYLPKEIDHIDGDRFNNNIENLREVTRTQNNYNTKIRNDNKSGIKGVCWSETSKGWRCYININKKRIELGCHKDIEFAELLIEEAREFYHGEFARTI